MLVLAIDTAADVCAAAVWDARAGAERGRCVLPMRTGHAEHLIGAAEAALEKARCGFSDLGRLAVSTGPGSFTGIRIGVAAARGFSLALGIPAIGVSTLEALAEEAREQVFGARAVLAALQTSGGRVQAAAYDAQGRELHAPAVVEPETAAAWAVELGRTGLAGNAAEKIAAAVPQHGFAVGPIGATADIAVYARLAADREAGEQPVPLYLRAPDAKPQGGAVLARRGG